MSQSFYALILLDEDVRMDSYGSTSLINVTEEAKEALRAYLNENGHKYADLPEMSMDGGFATIHKFQVATRSTGEILWTYPFDGENILEEAMLTLLTHEDYLNEANNQSETDADLYDVTESINLQQLFCINAAIPNFAPIDGNCYSCKNNIYLPLVKPGITTAKAGSEHITGCPHCNKTFLD
jgi:hypothetical protein